jgi:cardiolipin synthase A/B
MSCLVFMPADADHVPCAEPGSYPRRAGNRVRPLVDGEPAFRRICEAVERARRSVWVTVAFLDRDLELPDGRGSLFDVLDRAAARGLDVRVLFWREPELPRVLPDSTHFGGTPPERAWLAARGSRFAARWDHLPRYCHHQKSWVIDAGTPDEVAFVGGINLDRGSIVGPGHPPVRATLNVHDAYLELAGPAATDVHHNFVQRWNEASERGAADGVWPDAGAAGPLPFPRVLSPPRGTVSVQITRTVRPGAYRDATAAPGATSFPIGGGEASVLAQYLAAIDAARRTIYLENQFLASAAILERLAVALGRGVSVVFVLPGAPMAQVRAARTDPETAPFFAALGGLGEHPGFTLAALVASRGAGRYEDVYVHAKLAIVDDAWVTIGSTNVATRSFHGDTELNASLWDAETARGLRVALLHEHLGVDTAGLDDREALGRFREQAVRNREQRRKRGPLAGLAVAIAPGAYGEPEPWA